MIGAWETHKVTPDPIKPASEVIVHKTYHNQSGDWDIAYINRTTKINVNGILIEYEGEDSGIGLLFASKAAIQVSVMLEECWLVLGHFRISIDCNQKVGGSNGENIRDASNLVEYWT